MWLRTEPVCRDLPTPLSAAAAQAGLAGGRHRQMEQTGMHWRVPGAQAILHLRALYVNGDWDSFQQYRIEQQCQRLYPYKEQMDGLWDEEKADAA